MIGASYILFMLGLFIYLFIISPALTRKILFKNSKKSPKEIDKSLRKAGLIFIPFFVIQALHLLYLLGVINL